MLTAAGRMLWLFGKKALKQTKRLSPYKSSTYKQTFGKGKKQVVNTRFMGIKDKTSGTIKTAHELRPWASLTTRGLRKAGLSATKTRQALTGYNIGYKHVRKHKKLYGAGAAGAVLWDIADRDD
tara:strand:- start:116 stop:487 length:372 start_codon:yes stop_codon:yes gene_type:complete